jgi:hypothetical protein
MTRYAELDIAALVPVKVISAKLCSLGTMNGDNLIPHDGGA